MKKTLFIVMLVLFSTSSMGFNAATLRESSSEYTKKIEEDTSWCKTTTMSTAEFHDGKIYFGCNTEAINETVTWYKKDTMANYKAKSMKNDTWYYGPSRENNVWSKEEVVLHGRNGSGIKQYN